MQQFDRRFAGELPVLNGIALAVLGATTLLGVFAYGLVPESVTVHWSPGGGTAHWGPESLPKPLGLFLIPALATATFLFLRWLVRSGNVAGRS